jgi:hypothetical protein
MSGHIFGSAPVSTKVKEVLIGLLKHHVTATSTCSIAGVSKWMSGHVMTALIFEA